MGSACLGQRCTRVVRGGSTAGACGRGRVARVCRCVRRPACTQCRVAGTRRVAPQAARALTFTAPRFMSIKYAKSHEWAKLEGDIATVGISVLPRCSTRHACAPCLARRMIILLSVCVCAHLRARSAWQWQCIHTCIHTCVFVCVCLSVVCLCASHASMHVYMSVCVCVSLSLCMYVCVHIHTHMH